MNRRSRVFIIAAVLFLLCTACSSGTQTVEGTEAQQSFTQISRQEAAEMMEKDDGHIILDVRRQDEFESGHIPGAVCIPNESIGTERPAQLPDPDQIILVYCRSGNRSKQASKKLAAMGYTNVYEFGGIIDWTGETVTGGADTGSSDTGEPDIGSSETNAIWTAEEMPVHVRYDRMWIYSDYAESTDQEIIGELVDVIKTLEVGEETGMVTEDYTDILTFTFEDGSSKRLEFEDQCWVAEDQKRYQVEGLSALRELLDGLLE